MFVRDGEAVRVHLNGRRQPEIQTESPADFPVPSTICSSAAAAMVSPIGRGRLDEVAVFDRALSAEEIETMAH